jgi:hypothetical protein
METFVYSYHPVFKTYYKVDNRMCSIYIHLHKIIPQTMSLIMPTVDVRTENNEQKWTT